MQIQDERRELLSNETVLFGHVLHHLDPADEYVPLLHGVQIPAPKVDLKVPASHGVHSTPLDSARNPYRHQQDDSILLFS